MECIETGKGFAKCLEGRWGGPVYTVSFGGGLLMSASQLYLGKIIY